LKNGNVFARFSFKKFKNEPKIKAFHSNARNRALFKEINKKIRRENTLEKKKKALYEKLCAYSNSYLFILYRMKPVRTLYLLKWRKVIGYFEKNASLFSNER